MVVLLKSGSSTAVKLYCGWPAENKSIERRKKSHASWRCCDLNPASGRHRICQNFSTKYGSVSVPMVAECDGWCGCKQLHGQGISFVFWAKRRGSLVAFFSSQSALGHEEEVHSVWQRENQFRMDIKEKQTPLVTLAMVEDLALEPGSSPSSSSPEIKPSILKVNLHYLEERDVEVLSKRILSLSRSNKVRSALELYASMEVSGLRPNAHACNSLLACLLRNGSVDDGLRVFEMMKKKELATSHTYSLMLKAVASIYGCDSALEMFKALESEDISKEKFDVIIYNTMIGACAKTRNWVAAEKFWRKLKLNALTGTKITYDLLISTFVQCGQTELALDAYHEMIQRKLEPGEDVMKAIIASCSKEGKWNLALNVFQKMLNSGFKPNIIAFNALINCLGKAGEVDLAFRIFNIMKNSGHMPDSYTWRSLLGSLYRSNRYADALSLFENIKMEQASQLNAHLYNVALLSCQRLGLWERSLQLLWHMETSGVQVSTVSYNHVICACEAARKPKVALQVYQHMIHQKCAPDTFTYLALIRACVWGSLWMEVEEILEDVAPNASLYNALIHGFSLRGKTTLAKKLYEKMRSIGLKPDGKTRALMLQHLSSNRIQRHPRYVCRARP